jgi:hypothetical protein
MSNQPENEMQQTPTPEEVRQYLLAEIETSQQVVAKLSDEELEEIAGAGAGLSGMIATYKFQRSQQYNYDNRPDNRPSIMTSLGNAWQNGARTGNALAAQGINGSSDMLKHMHQYGGPYRNAGAQ